MPSRRFDFGERVFVRSVGCHSSIKKIAPVWEAGKSDPLTVHYDVGLGRLFRPEELEPAIKDERHSLGRRHQIKARALPPAMTDEEAENVVNLARSA